MLLVFSSNIAPFFSSAVAVDDPPAEDLRVRQRIEALHSASLSAGPSFWRDRDRGLALVLLQDRVGYVATLIEKFRSTLSGVYRTLFPLNAPMETLGGLWQEFATPRWVRALVREQTTGGAHLAFAFSRAHYPNMNLELIGGAYANLPDAQRPFMGDHMEAAIGPAMSLVGVVLDRDDTLAQQQGQGQGLV